MSEQKPAAAPPRSVIVITLGLVTLLAIAVAVVGLVLSGHSNNDAGAVPPIAPTSRSGPLPLPPVPAPAAESASCAALLAAVPAEIASDSEKLRREELMRPVPAGAAAWGTPAREPVVLRCGLDRPNELTPTSQLIEVSGVKWLHLAGNGASTMIAVDRPVYVALTIPEAAGSGALQDISVAVRSALPAGPVRAIG